MQILWLLFSVVQMLRGAHSATNDEAPDCTAATHTVPLNGSHIVHTWQPDGDCPWPQNRSSKWWTGPRWLVMQLRRPMLVERVSVENWGGEWLTAGAEGSPVSAFGAASLPLELRLQDPCHSCWDAFTRVGWRRIGNAAQGMQTPDALILINGTAGLDFHSINASGRKSPHVLRITKPSNIQKHGLAAARTGEKLGFSVTSCVTNNNNNNNTKQIRCWLTGGTHVEDLTQVGDIIDLDPNGNEKRYFQARLQLPRHDQLRCGVSGEAMPFFEETLGADVFEFRNSRKKLEVSPAALVAGHAAAVMFLSDLNAESVHRCFLSEGISSAWQNLTLVNQTKTKQRDASCRFVLRQQSVFKLDVSGSVINWQILCAVILPQRTQRVSYQVHRITAVSAPCVTEVNLDSENFWWDGEVKQVRVTSRNCSWWRATHTCWLSKAGEAHGPQLTKTNESDFTSTHQLRVSRWMAERDWLIRCSVNQSGFLYEDVTSQSRWQPDVFYKPVLSMSKNSFNGSHLSVSITSSDSKPPVSSMSCIMTDLYHLCQREMYFVRNTSRTWSFIAEFRATLNVTCVAKQLHGGKLVAESLLSFQPFELALRPRILDTLKGQDQRNRDFILTALMLIFTATVFSALSWKLAWRRARSQLAPSQQCNRCEMQQRAVNQSPAAAAAAAASDSCPYDYQTVDPADRGTFEYDLPDEAQNASAVVGHRLLGSRQAASSSEPVTYINMRAM